MKLQHLSVIFIIIIVPIAMVLSTYIENLIDVSNKERSYDNALYNSTYDAVRAYQMNTANNSYASVNTSRKRDIRATANSFFNSLKSGLSLSGYSKDDLNNYIPAILFTLYDGFYIYGPYENVASENDNKIDFNTSSDIDNVEHDVKQYVYYSCQYCSENNYNLIVNYTLDNYISYNGWIRENGEKKYVSGSGYYINYDKITLNQANKTVTIKGVNNNDVTIESEKLDEYISFIDEYSVNGGKVSMTRAGTPQRFTYINYHDEKYYYDPSPNTSNRSYSGVPIFYLSGDTRTYISKNMEDTLKSFIGVDNIDANNFRDVNAFYYYRDAYNFSVNAKNVLQRIDLSDSDVIKTKSYNQTYTITNDNFINLDVNKDKSSSHIKYDYQNKKVFDISDENDPELDSSSFNEHRMDVIISTVEYALTNAIANYNNYFSSGYEFRMPTLTETDWERISNNVTVVSFMQGLVVGNYKYYNNYAVVVNTKNKEFVSKDAIYVENTSNIDNYNNNTSNYHNPRCEAINSTAGNYIGYRIIDYDIQTLSQLSYTYMENGIIHEVQNGKDKQTGEDAENVVNYYYRPGTGGYECVISLDDDKLESDNLMTGNSKTVDGNVINVNPGIRKAYITALAREKNASYKNLDVFNLD